MTKKRPYKWIQASDIGKRGHKGALRRYLHIREGKNIPFLLLKKTAQEHGVHGYQARQALTMRGLKHHHGSSSKASLAKRRRRARHGHMR
jgi:hypothetical protein